eukprot:c24334_g1_i6 orf=1152-2321(-)
MEESVESGEESVVAAGATRVSINSSDSLSPGCSPFMQLGSGTPSPTRTAYSDRFIPSRSGSNLNGFALLDTSPSGANAARCNDGRDDGAAAYSVLLRTELFGSEAGQLSPTTPETCTVFSSRDLKNTPISPSKNIFRFKSDLRGHPSNSKVESPYSLSPIGADRELRGIVTAPRKCPRKIARSPYKIWDTNQCKKIRTLGGHLTRVGTLAWNSHILSSGSQDHSILQRDIRVQDDFISKLVGHKSEICGLKWSYDDRELASGGNDNQLFVWNQQSTQPILRFSEHTSSVKAIAWSPHQHGLLASGGGAVDRCIRFWSTTTNSHLNCVDTGSQVCNLAWSKNVNEVVSTHGYYQNQIIVWRYPSMSKLATLTGHTLRVLYLAVSPDGQVM